MTWQITNRYNGEAILSGGGELRGTNLIGANLSGANLIEADLREADLIGASLIGANLSGANLIGASLIGANLSGANLIGADPRGANLRGANLIGADLRGANLRGANLIGANLRRTNLVDCGQRADGYQFFIHARENAEPLVLAGCRYLPISEARQHWRVTRGDSLLGKESQALIDHGLRLLAIRELWGGTAEAAE